MIYSVRHTTRYRYQEPVRENVMEIRKQPRSEGGQRCLNFSLELSQQTRIFRYIDYLGNVIHHFDVPWHHDELTVVGEAIVEVKPSNGLPAFEGWEALDRLVAGDDYYDMLLPSQLVLPTRALGRLAAELRVERNRPGLSAVEDLRRAVHQALQLAPEQENQSLDQALESRLGRSHDFVHVLLGLLRMLEIPCRYVSGYLFQGSGERSDLRHAWAEVLLPVSGSAHWLGVDPTLDAFADHRYIRACVGRDRADVPATRSVCKGNAQSEKNTAIEVHLPVEPGPGIEQ